MSKINIRTKGASAERAFSKIVQGVIDDVYIEYYDKNSNKIKTWPKIERNLMQTASGGYDLVGLPFLGIEVKRQETLSLNAWWKQTVDQCTKGEIPVLAYKQSRKAWRVRMTSILPICYRNRLKDNTTFTWFLSDISLEDFKYWLEQELTHRLTYNLGIGVIE